MSNETPRKSWGSGRVAFVARLPTIRSEMGQGLPLTAIYARHQTALGIGYQSFCKLVTRYAGDAKLGASLPAARDQTPEQTSPAPPPPPPAPAAGIPAHARHEPASRPTFHHDGRTKEGEPEQLFGPGFLPGSRK